MVKSFISAAVVVAFVAQAPKANATGDVQLNNRIVGTVVAKVTLPDGVTGVESAFTAQLVLVGEDNSLTPLLPTTVFRDGIAAGFVEPVDIRLSSHAAGDEVTFILRAYHGANWETAAMRGESAAVTVGLGGHYRENRPPIPPTTLNGLEGFSVTELPDGYVWSSTRGTSFVLAPEPSTIALGLLGGAALLMLRRRTGQ